MTALDWIVAMWAFTAMQIIIIGAILDHRLKQILKVLADEAAETRANRFIRS